MLISGRFYKAVFIKSSFRPVQLSFRVISLCEMKNALPRLRLVKMAAHTARVQPIDLVASHPFWTDRVCDFFLISNTCNSDRLNTITI